MTMLKAFLLVLTLALLGCKEPKSKQGSAAAPATSEPRDTAKATATNPIVYHARGRVVQVKFSKAGHGVSIVVDHEDIPGLMSAMRMEFRLIDPSIAGRVHIGDKIAFDLSDQPEGDEAVTQETQLPADTPLRLATTVMAMPATAPVSQRQR